MFQAIETKYIGPSNVKGSRVQAKAGPGVRYYNWDDALNASDNYREAARRYAEEFNWFGTWRGGATRKGFVFVCGDGFEFFASAKKGS